MIDELSAICREHVLAEKILIVPSLAVGHQIADRLAVECASWVNLRSETVRTLIDRVIGFDAAEAGLMMLSRAQALALVEEACDDVLTEGSYFHQLSGQPGLYRAVQSTLDDLRHAHVDLRRVPDDPFEEVKKRDELMRIRKRYDELLLQKNAIDRTGLLHLATEAVRKDDDRRRFGFVDGTIWLLVDGVELTAAEEQFLQSLARGGLRQIGAENDAGLASQSVMFVQAIGEENEVRDCFRELLRADVTVDDAELIYTHPSAYRPLVYELANEYGIACTFAEGIAASFTRPGQAVMGFLHWLGSDFDAPTLRRLAASGVLDLRDEGSLASGALARTIRDAAIGWGRERTVSQLEALLARTEASASEDGEARDRRDVERVTSARDFARAIVGSVPVPDDAGRVALAEVADAASRFAQRYAFAGSELDSIAKAALCRLLTELSEVGSSRATLSMCAERLLAAIASLHVAASNPRPGHLHVTTISLGGYAHRTRTFIVGLDDGRFPGQPLQDPVLLDEERSRINASITPGKLPLIAEQSIERLVDFRRLLGRVAERGGSLRLSYSARNLLEEREQFPSKAMLEVFRIATGKEDSDYESLIAGSAEHRADFLPRERYASETEWWLAQARRAPAAVLAAAVREAYAWLADGAAADSARESDLFTKFDGKIESRPEILDPRISGVVVSCSRIEELAACPYRYFLRRVLGIDAEEELQRDPLEWLNPMQYGSLFHSVAEDFMNRLGGAKPTETHHALLREIAHDGLLREKERVPPPNDASFLLRERELYEACDFFLRNEIEHCQSVTPRYFEVPFGFDEESLCDIASREPVEIETNGGPLKIRGRIDRVDERADGALEIWDYKTGSNYKFKQPGYLHRGQIVQHAVYGRAMELLTESHGDRRRVAKSGYFFPSEKGEGERIPKEGNAEELSTLLSLLFDMVADGSFPHASEDACRFCDFRTLCDLKPAGAQGARKIANPANASDGMKAWRRIQEIR